MCETVSSVKRVLLSHGKKALLYMYTVRYYGRGFFNRFEHCKGGNIVLTTFFTARDLHQNANIACTQDDISIRHDSLTGVPTRQLTLAFINSLLTKAIGHPKNYAFLLVNLDNFCLTNHYFGFTVGDLLLIQLVKRFKVCLGATGIVTRLSGDEFLIIVQLENEGQATTIANQLLQVSREPFPLDNDSEINITISIGIAMFPRDGNNAEKLLMCVEQALKTAKRLGKNNYQYYIPALSKTEKAQEWAFINHSLPKALKKKEFLLYFQPKVELLTGKVTGMEALIRWNHSEVGFISPHKFIPLSEENGLIIPIGDWVLYTACLQLKTWQKQGYPPLRVAINLSSVQISQQDFVAKVEQTLSVTGLEPQWLEFEITETTIMKKVEENINTLKYLKDLGITISIDDFGTGYSSLNYLKKLPIDYLKIDQSFIRDILTNSDDATIVSAIISLAHNLHCKVIAEGVETTEQRDFLKENNCDEIQGYLYSKPLPPHKFVGLSGLA